MASIVSRFQGCLVGAVVGDCIGALYEMSGVVSIQEVLKTVEDLETNFKKAQGKQKVKQGKLPYTDDTAMTRVLAASFIKHKRLDVGDLARSFAEEYKASPGRGYGGNVSTVFKALLDPKLEDVFEPASKQFDGQGSYGNGGAMRISPAALFGYKDSDFEKLMDLAIQSTKITHSHTQAIQGAVLQCSAVDLSLRQDNSKEFNTDKFIDDLLDRMRPLEEEGIKKTDDGTGPPSPTKKSERSAENTKKTPYCSKLETIREFLQKDVPKEEIEKVLGNNISAFGSVPTAIYSFLKALKDIPGLEGKNVFERTIVYAISLGGDTDTIATMAGAIAGAFHGVEFVPAAWQAYCEGVKDAKKYADQLYELQIVEKETEL